MRALQITELTGPESALRLVDVPRPEPSHPVTPGRGVLIDVRAAGVGFPEVLQTRGEYQFKVPLPFVPGLEVSGVVLSAPDGAPVRERDRVAAFCMLGGYAERVSEPGILQLCANDSVKAAFWGDWEVELTRRTGRQVAWRIDNDLAWHASFAQAVPS